MSAFTVGKLMVCLVLFLTACTARISEPEKPAASSYLDKAKQAESTDEKLYYYKKALSIDTNDVDALIGRGNAYISKAASGRERDLLGTRSPWFRTKGMADLTRAIELAPESAAAYLGRGRAHRYVGNDEQALADFNRVIAIEPKNPQAYIERSHVFRAMNKNDRQFSDLEHALSLDPQSISAILGKALAFTEQKQYESALTEIKKAIEIDPDYPAIYTIRAHINRQQEKVREAVADYSRAIKLQPKNNHLYEQRSYLYRKLGKKELAEADEKKKFDLMSDAHFLRGAWGGGDEALDSLSKAIELNPWDYSYYMIRGRVFGSKGDFERALADLRQAVEIGFDMPDPYIFRSIVYGEVGRYEEAIADLKIACDLGRCEEYQVAVNSVIPMRGKIVDEETLEPVDGALIVLKRTANVREAWSGKTSLHRDYGTQYGISDAQGNFIIPPLSNRPVVPDLMGRETVTYIEGVYHPNYWNGRGTSLEDPENVIINARKGTIISEGNFSKLFTREERLKLRGEDLQRFVEILKTWQPTYGGDEIKLLIARMKGILEFNKMK